MIARPVRFESAQPCDLNRLRRLIENDLNDSEMESVTEHLNSCDVCRAELDRSTHTDAEWQQSRMTVLSSLGITEVAEGALRNHRPPSDHDAKPKLSLLSWLQKPNEKQSDAGYLGVLDRYLIKRVVGTGGMGVVFEGWDEELHRPVAIKAMHPHLASIGVAKQRFVREARAAAAIVHPNVVAIHAVNAEFDPPYLVMPLIAGESLQARIDRQGILEIDAVLRIACQLADGLAAAHAHGLVHRDIKPANILVEHGTERALITDFGVVRALDDATMTTSGAIAGTPEYMSPEQSRGETLDHRSDLFSLGSVVYAMLSGRSPFRANSTLSVLRKITDEKPRSLREYNPHVPAWMISLLDWLHAKEPRMRANSAGEVADELRKALSYWHDPIHHPLPSLLAGRMKRWALPRWIQWVFIALLFAVTVYGLVQFNRPIQNDSATNAEIVSANDNTNETTNNENEDEPKQFQQTDVLDPLAAIEIDLAIESVAREIESLEASVIDKQ